MANNATLIHDRLKAKGLNEFAIAGIMGNLGEESGLIPNNLQNTFNKKLNMTDAEYTAAVDNGSYKNFATDRAGYGIAQWTASNRKKGLLEAAVAAKKSIGDIILQVDYLWAELQTAYFAKLLNILENATSVKEASDAFLTIFEVPANAASKKDKRAASSQKYYDMFNKSTSTSSTPKTSAFKPRLKAPSTTDKHWIHSTKGGLNECILISGSSCIPNCVGYAWGRWYEILGKRPNLSRANAEMWYGTNDGYKRSKTPALGAVICWAKGKVGPSSDGAGHVAVVEEIKPNGDIVTSNSGYNSTRFWTKTITKASGYALKGYTFQGFILLPGTTGTSIPTTPTTQNKECNYRVQITSKNLRIRSEPTTNAKINGIIEPGVYTIVEEADGKGASKWGKLKSGAGWVSLDYCKKL